MYDCGVYEECSLGVYKGILSTRIIIRLLDYFMSLYLTHHTPPILYNNLKLIQLWSKIVLVAWHRPPLFILSYPHSLVKTINQRFTPFGFEPRSECTKTINACLSSLYLEWRTSGGEGSFWFLHRWMTLQTTLHFSCIHWMHTHTPRSLCANQLTSHPPHNQSKSEYKVAV